MELGRNELRKCADDETFTGLFAMLEHRFREPDMAALLLCQIADYRTHDAPGKPQITADEAAKFADHCATLQLPSLDEFAIFDFFHKNDEIDLVEFFEVACRFSAVGSPTEWSEHSGKLQLLQWWLEQRGLYPS